MDGLIAALLGILEPGSDCWHGRRRSDYRPRDPVTDLRTQPAGRLGFAYICAGSIGAKSR